MDAANQASVGKITGFDNMPAGFYAMTERTQSLLDLCVSMPQAEYASGEVLLPEGVRTGTLYVLIDGEVEIVREDVQIDTVGTSGAIFGEISLLLDIPHTATVRTLRPSRFYKIDRAAAFLAEHHELIRELARILAQRLNRTTNLLLDLKRHFVGLPSALIGVTLEVQGNDVPAGLSGTVPLPPS
jgi:CRP/FNR family cyclic AMP-dependent transcriptional regulator